jgi:hypothetical protein
MMSSFRRIESKSLTGTGLVLNDAPNRDGRDVPETIRLTVLMPQES